MNSKVYKIISAIIGIIGFIGGIACGKIFETITVNSKYSTLYDHHFNTKLMLSIWIGSILLCLIFIGIATILSNQENIIAKLNNFNKTEQPDENVIEIQKTEDIKKETVAKELIQNIQNRELSDDEIKCPHCGKIQNKSVKRCLSCSKLINE